MLARNDVVWRGLSIAQAAVKYGVARSTVWRWIKKSRGVHGNDFIETFSSAPKHQANQIKPEIVHRIISLRKQLNRCAPVIHAHLQAEGITVSLSSVERTLRRNKLTRWKKKQASFYTPLPRPLAIAPGVLVQMDTIHFIKPNKSRFYIYAVIDTYSRFAYAEYHPKLSQMLSLQVILHAQRMFDFPIRMMQTDNGPEFKDGLAHALGRKGIHLRHSRVRTPNDNAHIERFNRTIQEECFGGKPPNEKDITRKLRRYIAFYNTHRLHLGLNLQTPISFVAKVLT